MIWWEKEEEGEGGVSAARDSGTAAALLTFLLNPIGGLFLEPQGLDFYFSRNGRDPKVPEAGVCLHQNLQHCKADPDKTKIAHASVVDAQRTLEMETRTQSGPVHIVRASLATPYNPDP